MQIPASRYVLQWRWKTVLVTMVLVVVFIKLGLWQWHKAQVRQAMQDVLNANPEQVLVVDADILKQETHVVQLHGKRIQLTGRYLPQYTVLLDNQVENGQAGFHVLTPLLLEGQTLGEGKQVVVWINRGWIAGFAEHQKLPSIATSTDIQRIQGLAWQIKKTAFQLGTPAMDWQLVQAVIDFSRLRKHVPYAMPSMVIKLDPSVAKDGFVRHWQLPAGEVEKNLGYAYQWFGFALAAVLIALYQMLEKKSGSA